ncbi:MAG: glutamate 5-kinase [Dehalococcoidia bacterium]|nr:glutamate 5-kinase [Dehalococcoidia bacterium]
MPHWSGQRAIVTNHTESGMTQNAALPRNQLIIAKLGTGALTGGGDQLDEGLIASIAKQVAEIVAAQSQVIVVTSAAVALGRSIIGLKGKGRGVATLQALAAIGQHHLMQSWEGAFAQHGLTVAQALITRSDFTAGRSAVNIRRTLRELLGFGVIPVINENDVVASEELSETLGDNDTLSAALTNLMAADMLILLTDRDGLYDSDPRTNPDAALIHHVDRVTDDILAMAAEMPSELGRGGMASKIRAAAEATSWGTSVVIANGKTPDVLLRIARGEDIGTRFEAWGRRRPSARRRSLGPLFVRGQVVVDEGAATALRRGTSSLLAVGVREVRGEFTTGDIVEILGPDETGVARGAVSYPAGLMRRLAGLHNAEVRQFFEAEDNASATYHGEEMVHRDHLTLL